MISRSKTVYSRQELLEFKGLILKKYETATAEYNSLLQHLKDNSTSDTDAVWSNASHVSESSSKEEISFIISRLRKYISALTAALARIEHRSYGICAKTGQHIPKNRLRAVPHATLSLEAKLKDN